MLLCGKVHQQQNNLGDNNVVRNFTGKCICFDEVKRVELSVFLQRVICTFNRVDHFFVALVRAASGPRVIKMQVSLMDLSSRGTSWHPMDVPVILVTKMVDARHGTHLHAQLFLGVGRSSIDQKCQW